MVEARRRANERVREAIGAVDGAGDPQRWAFFCECESPHCDELVRLQICEFDALVAARRRVLADAHAARLEAADARQAARALVGQAEQALRRNGEVRRAAESR